MDRTTAKTYLDHYGRDESATIPILQAIQKDYGYLPQPLLEAIVAQSRIHANQLYGVATFYSQFSLSAKGRHIIKVCAGTACHVNESDRLISVLEDTLHIRSGETTSDGRFSLETVACLGCCSLAPVMMVGADVYAKLSSDKVTKVLSAYV